jgi:hypothetical protein
MVPSFIRVASTLKDLIEDKVDKGESRVLISPYLSKATLDIIGLVGKKKNIIRFSYYAFINLRIFFFIRF